MKRSRAVSHLVEMAEGCAEVNDKLGMLVETGPRLSSFWAFGKVLDPDHEWTDEDRWADSAIGLTMPESKLPWQAPPVSATWIGELAGWHKRPVVTLWRSSEAPVWNHYIVEPMLLWDSAGLRQHAIASLREGSEMEHHREPAPSREELEARVRRELEVSLSAVRRAARAYESHRWRRANHLKYADALFAATDGYLDLAAIAKN